MIEDMGCCKFSALELNLRVEVVPLAQCEVSRNANRPWSILSY